MQQSHDDTKDPSAKSGWRGYLQLAAIIAFIVVALYFARAPEQETSAFALAQGEQQSAPVVQVIQPVPVESALTVRLTGAVSLEERVAVASEVAGRISRISPEFRNGGFIPANETIVEIAREKYELNVLAAEAVVKAAEASLRIAETENANADEAIRAPLVARAEAELEIARIAQKQAELELAQTSISLPFDVRVVQSDASVGMLAGPTELVGRNARLGIAYRLDALQVEAPVDPEDLRLLAPVIGRPARIITSAGVLETEVVRVSSVVARKSRLATVFLRFSDALPKDTLPVPGTFVEVVIRGPSHPNSYDLPESVLQEHGRVWIVRNGAMEAVVPNPIGPTEMGLAVDAFDSGDGIVVGFLPEAREGLPVEVAEVAAAE